MQLVDLDTVTRRHMIGEIKTDIDRNLLYMSPRLSERGRSEYPGLLLEAAERADAASLAAKLRVAGILREYEQASRNGKTISKRVPVNAADTLAEGEFNRIYARAVCIRAVEDGIEEVIIYRAKDVASPRPESEAKIGSAIRAGLLLADLRASSGVEPALGIPPGPNSGLSVRLPSQGAQVHDAERGLPLEV